LIIIDSDPDYNENTKAILIYETPSGFKRGYTASELEILIQPGVVLKKTREPYLQRFTRNAIYRIDHEESPTDKNPNGYLVYTCSLVGAHQSLPKFVIDE